MSELEKQFLKNQIKKLKKNENQCQNAACEQKNHQREMKIWFKQKTRPRMNLEWIGKSF